MISPGFLGFSINQSKDVLPDGASSCHDVCMLIEGFVFAAYSRSTAGYIVLDCKVVSCHDPVGLPGRWVIGDGAAEMAAIRPLYARLSFLTCSDSFHIPDT